MIIYKLSISFTEIIPLPFLPKAVDPKKIASPPTIIPYELTPMRLKFDPKKITAVDPKLFYLTQLTPRRLQVDLHRYFT